MLVYVRFWVFFAKGCLCEQEWTLNLITIPIMTAKTICNEHQISLSFHMWSSWIMELMNIFNIILGYLGRFSILEDKLNIYDTTSVYSAFSSLHF